MSGLDKRLHEILGVGEPGGGDLQDQLNDLDEENRPREMFDLVVYDEVESKVVAPNVNPDALEDYKKARTILYGLLDRGTSMLDGSLMVAKESEHPRAYEVSASIMRNISEMTKDLLSLQKVLHPKESASAGTIKTDSVNIQNNTYNQVPVQSEKDNIKDILGELEDDVKKS